MLLDKTNITVEIETLRKDYIDKHSSWEIYKNRICLNNHANIDDPVADAGQRMIYTEYKFMNNAFKDSIWEKTLKLLPGKIGRARIMLMGPEKLLSMHRDIENRWHLALFTDPACIFYDHEDNKAFHIPADGFFYKVNTRRLHTVFNSTNNFTRIHLVVCEYV